MGQIRPKHYKRGIKMKKMIKLIGILALIAVLGFAVSCGEPGGGACTTHNFKWVVTNTTYPASSTETCIKCKETRGSPRTTQIGDTGPAGGIIFHIVPGGFNVQGYSGGPAHLNFAAYTAYYLEAAPANEPSTAQWGAYGTSIPGVTTFTSLSVAEASLLGNGRKDTYIIVNHLGTSETGRAAQRCANKSLNGFTDWFLPSLGELNQLYNNRVAVGNLGTNWYWSSSQNSVNSAWYQGIGSGSRSGGGKESYGDVRAVRAF